MSEWNPLRVVVGEDDVLFREGLVRLLAEAGHEVVAYAGDARDLLGKALAFRPDVVVTDVRMPPGDGADGLVAAIELRRRSPSAPVLVLSHFYEPELALDLFGESPRGVGYLLKERVGDLGSFLDAVGRVAAGGTALDPEVVARLIGRHGRHDALARLSPRQLDVLASMAGGRSNRGIAGDLHLSEAAVEKHITALFRLLDIEPSGGEHRRVRAVLAYLRATGSRSWLGGGAQG
jgi:DNA-binding NarL/FixJ family response regulator